MTGSLAALRGGQLPASLEPHWRELLKNQFHDILPGSSIGEVYARAERELSEVSTPSSASGRCGHENALLRVELGDDGTLHSVFDKRVEREVLAGRGNQAWAYVDTPREWDAWDIDVDYRDQASEITHLLSCEVIERDPHRAALRIVRRFRDSVITQELRLRANSPRLEFATVCSWRERH